MGFKEQSAGLDPQARRHTWELVRAIRERGATVVLVTHFMDEAEQLCDRVAFIDHGRVAALDTPAALTGQGQAQAGMRILFTADNGFDASGALRALPDVTDVTQNGSTIIVSGSGPLMARVATALAERNLIPPDLRTERVTLEDVFLSLTGAAIRD
jgi:ABC-2 type transport system ATP-binding protein